MDYFQEHSWSVELIPLIESGGAHLQNLCPMSLVDYYWKKGMLMGVFGQG